MTPEKIEELKQLALSAHKGSEYLDWVFDEDTVVTEGSIYIISSDVNEEDGRFIAAASPKTMLSLLNLAEECLRLREERDGYATALDHEIARVEIQCRRSEKAEADAAALAEADHAQIVRLTAEVEQLKNLTTMDKAKALDAYVALAKERNALRAEVRRMQTLCEDAGISRKVVRGG